MFPFLLLLQSYHTISRMATTSRKLGTQHRVSIWLGKSNRLKKSFLLYKVSCSIVEYVLSIDITLLLTYILNHK